MDAREFLTRWAETVIADVGPGLPCRVERVGYDDEHPPPAELAALDFEVTSWEELAARFVDLEGQLSIEMADPDGGWTCCYLRPADRAWSIAGLASGVQDYLVESTAGWGQALPPCPGHPHPLSPDVVDDAAVWSCPADRHIVRPIPDRPA